MLPKFFWLIVVLFHITFNILEIYQNITAHTLINIHEISFASYNLSLFHFYPNYWYHQISWFIAFYLILIIQLCVSNNNGSVRRRWYVYSLITHKLSWIGEALSLAELGKCQVLPARLLTRKKKRKSFHLRFEPTTLNWSHKDLPLNNQDLMAKGILDCLINLLYFVLSFFIYFFGLTLAIPTL